MRLVDVNGDVVLDGYGEGVDQDVDVSDYDRDIIVRAVNMHDELVDALHEAVACIDSGAAGHHDAPARGPCNCVRCRARALLTRAKEGT
jgi:hypothetical protein